MAKYKVGDKVRVKSLEWWNTQPKINAGRSVKCGAESFSKDMTKYCNDELTICSIYDKFYKVKENNFNWTEEMFSRGFPECEICPKTKPVSKFFTELSAAINKVVSENKQGITIEEKDGSIIITPIEDKEEDLPIGTFVVCSNNTEYWVIGVYEGYNLISTRIDGKDGGECRNYIIPFDKFNPSDIQESLKHNIVK